MAVAFNRLEISELYFEQMRRHVAGIAPEEACGLLGGQISGGIGRVSAVLAVTNALHSPVRFRMEPLEQLKAFEQLDAQGLELLCIYHSHPLGPPAPSATDLVEAFYPETAYLIWSLGEAGWVCRAFDLENRRSLPIDVHPSEMVE